MCAASVMVLEPAYTIVLVVAHEQLSKNSLLTLIPNRKVTRGLKGARFATTGSRSSGL